MTRDRASCAALHSLIAGLCAVVVSAPAAAGDASLQNACFAPAVLKAANGESLVRRGDRSFDGAAPAQTLHAASPVPAHLRGAIRRVDLPEGEKMIALTFDLCERQGEVAGYDGEVIDYLRREGVKATLFAGGKWMRSHSQRAEQLMLDPLFELANHSDTHRNLRALDAAAMHGEIMGPQRTYEAMRTQVAAKQCVAASGKAIDAVPQRLGLFRFPFGACSKASLDAVNDAGMLAIQWDVSTGDPTKDQSAKAIARAMVGEARPGSILISHANGRGWHTAAALPIAIPKLKAMGYQFVTVSELLAKGKPVIADACYSARPGDTNRYDFLFASRAGAKAAKSLRTAKAASKKHRAPRHAAGASKVRTVRATSAPRKPTTKKS